MFNYVVNSSWFKPICKNCVSKKISLAIQKHYLKKYKTYSFEEFPRRLLKFIVWLEQNERCNVCGYSLFNIKTGPYNLHHKDGNRENNKRENLEVLCANCHMMTDNWGHKHSNHPSYEQWKKHISEILDDIGYKHFH